MHARYSSDIYGYNQCKELNLNGEFEKVIETYNEYVHHKNDAYINLLKQIGLTLFNSNLSYFDLGQTLFGCIDAIDFINSVVKTKINVDDVEWYGVDISNFFNQFSKKYTLAIKYIHSQTIKIKSKIYFLPKE